MISLMEFVIPGIRKVLFPLRLAIIAVRHH